jgi:transcriptional regulator with XRE-family HTH domain
MEAESTESNALANRRPLLFAETLDGLIHAHGYSRRRKVMCTKVGISESALSHYLNGRSQPTFDTLIALAGFFEVSLDFLVFGERQPMSEKSAVLEIATSVQQAMAAASNKAGRQLDYSTRISIELFRRVDELAAELSESSETSAGFLTVSDAISIEGSTRAMRIMTKRFQCDVQAEEDGEVRPGPFLAVVIANLQMGRTYDYLLCCEGSPWGEEIEKFRHLLRSYGVSNEEQSQINFRVSPLELICSACLHVVDMTAVPDMLTPLLERYRDFINAEGQFTYISVQNELAEGGLVLEPMYRDAVNRFFDNMWNSGSRA